MRYYEKLFLPPSTCRSKEINKPPHIALRHLLVRRPKVGKSWRKKIHSVSRIHSVSIRLFWTFLFGFGFLRWRLMLLYFLLLRRMLLLKLLRLLSVPLFHLLFLCVVGIFLRSFLVFLFLLLLEFLVFLILFGGKLFLLLLVFLVGRGIAGVGRRVGMRL